MSVYMETVAVLADAVLVAAVEVRMPELWQPWRIVYECIDDVCEMRVIGY
jgi:hypothetical protein